jgi:hypothetical protein
MVTRALMIGSYSDSCWRLAAASWKGGWRCIDNLNGELGSDLLCQAVERPLIRLRFATV